MDYQKYIYLQAIDKYGNMTKAAQQLYISQPALTKFLNKLERELGVKLFDRQVNPLQITYAGELYMAQVEQIITMEKNLRHQFEEINDLKRGRFSIGIPPLRGAYWLPEILPPFLKAYPGIQVNVKEGNSTYFEEELQRGSLDICIYTLPVFSDDVDYRVIGDDRIFLIVSRDHQILKEVDLSKNSTSNPLLISPERLEGESFISLTPQQGLYRTMKELFAIHNIQKTKIVMEISNCETAYRLATQGVGLFFAPECCAIQLRSMEQQPIFCTLDDPLYARKLIVAYRKGRVLSNAMERFIQMTEQLARTNSYLTLEKYN